MAQVEFKKKFGVVQRHKRALQVFSSSISLAFNDKMSENFHRWSGREFGWEVTMQMRRGTGGKVLGFGELEVKFWVEGNTFFVVEKD